MNLERARMLAVDLIASFAGGDWCFSFDASRRRFGACHFLEKRISLSGPFVRLNDETRVLDTILHEIAHALTPRPDALVCGAESSGSDYDLTMGHTDEWREKCLELGGNGERCFSSDNTVMVVPLSYIGTCPRCYDQVKRYRAARAARCGCGDIFIWNRG